MDLLLWLFDPGQSDMLLGILGSLFGSKPKKPKASENDKALAEVSQGQFQRYKDKFAPLTKDLDAMSRQNKSATLRGRGNADVMQSLGTARAPGANGQMGSALRVGTRGLGTALSGGSEQARERKARLTKGVMNAATGAGQDAIRGLGQATQISTGRAIDKMHNDYAKGQLVADFTGSVLGGAAAVGMNSGSGGAKPMGARDSVFTVHGSTGNGMRDKRTGFSGVGL